MRMESKHCNECKETKPASDFGKRKRKNGRVTLTTLCRKCDLARFNRWKYRDHGKYLARRRDQRAARLAAGSREILAQVLSRYRLSVKDFDAMLANQGGVCAICGGPETSRNQHGPLRLSVDHDHSTGLVRGLLCRSCNNLLGQARDNCTLLERAADYLVKNYARWWHAERQKVATDA